MIVDKITDAEMSRLEDCKNSEDWDFAVKQIKAARGGNFPSDWWTMIEATGLNAEAFKSFGIVEDYANF